MYQSKHKPRGMDVEVEQWMADCVNHLFDRLDGAKIAYEIRHGRQVAIREAEMDLTFRGYPCKEQLIIKLRRWGGRNSERQAQPNGDAWLERLMKTIINSVNNARREQSRFQQQKENRRKRQAAAVKAFEDCNVVLDEHSVGRQSVLKIREDKETVGRITIGDLYPDKCILRLDDISLVQAQTVLALLGHAKKADK